MKTDIQNIIPDHHRELVEAVPKGALRSVAHGGILLGALCGAFACLLVPSWLIPVVVAVLLLIQRLWVWRNDRRFDACMAELDRQGLDWREGGV